MWERFSYYGMRGLLIFYLTQHFLFDDKTAAGQYGAYTSLVYLCRWSAASWPTATWARARRWRSARCCWWPATSPWRSRARRRPRSLTYHGRAYDFRVDGPRRTTARSS